MESILEKAYAKQKEIINAIENDIHKKNQRPLFHFACPAGWCNDPNGFSFFNNSFHLFYQWHPYSTQWGPMHWGHATSTDLLNWTIQPPALAPDSAADNEGCFSGTAIDFNGNHLLCYTGVSKKENQVFQNQCFAIGDGTTYKKLETNPAVTKNNIPFKYQVQDFRDPKIFKIDNKLFMLCVLKKMDDTGAMVLFENNNNDLDNWSFVKTIAESSDGKTKMWECPDYFNLNGKDIFIFSPQGMSEDFEKGFHDGNNSVYMIGNFNKNNFTFSPEIFSNKLSYTQIDYGIDFYAPQTTIAPDGRRILIGWMQSWESPVTPENFLWNGMMTIPRELEIKNNLLIQNPVKEIIQRRTNHKTFEINSDEFLKVPDARHFDLEINLTLEKKNKICIFIGDDKYSAELSFDCETCLLNFDRSNTINNGGKIKSRAVKIVPHDNKVHLRILADINSVEVFANHGETVFTNSFFIPEDSNGLCIKTKNKILLDYYSLK